MRPSEPRKRFPLIVLVVGVVLLLALATIVVVAAKRDPGHRPAIPQITPAAAPSAR